MAHTFIQQPNGKFTIWSSCIDAPVAYDLTEKEVIEYKAKGAYEIAKQDTAWYFKMHKYHTADYIKDRIIHWDNMDEPTQKAFSKIFGITKEEYEKEMGMDIYSDKEGNSMSWINPDYECRKNLIESAIEDIETYLQEMENNCTEWEISNDYLKLVRNSFNTFKETF